jgi:hypothetical protein
LTGKIIAAATPALFAAAVNLMQSAA